MNISGMGSPNMAAMQQMQARMFKAADQDGSGGLSKAEFKSAMADAPAGLGKAGNSDEAFGKLDADGDGSLTMGELDKGMKDIMKGFQSTMATFSAGSQDTGSSGLSAAKKNNSSDDLLQQLLDKLQAQYSSATQASLANPLSMFA